MNDTMRDAAFRAAVWQVIEQRAKELKDAAKAELAQLEPGDTVAGRWNGQTVGKATMTAGRTKLVIVDEHQFHNWLVGNHPTEVVSQVNSAFFSLLEKRAKELGAPVDFGGELIPGVELRAGAPYVSVRRDPDAPQVVAELLSQGRVALDGLKQIAAAE